MAISPARRRDQWGRPIARGGFNGFEEFIRTEGGIVSRRELLDAGWSADELRIARGCYGRPTRLRHGWYCSADVPEVVRAAWACGGPLACWSALEWYASRGSIAARSALDRRSCADPTTLMAIHISAEPHGHARSVELDDPPLIIRHRHATARTSHARWSVPLEIALAQTAWCSP